MINKIKSNLKYIAGNQTMVVGLSGGPDSTALLHILHILGYKVIAAHLDHEWREDSHKDVLFCKKFATNLNINFVSKKISELNLSIKYNGSKEEVARKARRHFLEQVAAEYNANYIALGHHLQDQIETFFIRIARGSSLDGLGCMKTLQALYLRPLLQITKEDILKYLQDNSLDFITDSSNESNDFLRNRIRNHLLPELNKIDSRFKNNFSRTLEQIQETNSFIKKRTSQELNKILINNKLDLKKLFLLDTFLQKQIVIEWLHSNNLQFVLTKNFIYEIFKFLQSPHGGSHQLSQQWLLSKKNNLVEVVTIKC